MAFRLRTPELAWIGFGVAAFAAVALIGLEVRGATFYGDEWGFLFRLADEPLASAMFDPPPGKYLVAVPIAAYAALAELFGIDSYLPYRLLGLALLVLAAGLFFELARRRAGYAWALGSSAMLLFLGSAWEVVVIPGRIPSQFAVCAGLGMVLALDRRDQRGDAVAAALAAVALVSHPVALAFMAAAAVRIVFGDSVNRWRRSWVFAAPLALYGLWYAILNEAPSQSGDRSLSGIASFTADGFVAVTAALSGTFRAPWTDAGNFLNEWAVALAIGLAAVGAISVVGRRRFSVGLAAALVALAASLVAPALEASGLNELRDPAAPRYLYPGAVLLLWVVVELVAMRPHRRGVAVAAGGFAAVLLLSGLVSNITQIREIGEQQADVGRTVKAELGALELARAARDGDASVADGASQASVDALVFASGAAGGAAHLIAAGAPAYFSISDAFGTPAFDEAALRDLPEPLRQQVDRVVTAAIPVTLEPSSAERPATDEAAWTEAISAPGLRRQGSCLRLGGAVSDDDPQKGRAATTLAVTPSMQVWIGADQQPSPLIHVGRLADTPVSPVAWPAGEPAATLALPAGGLGSEPWELQLAGSSQLTACPA